MAKNTKINTQNKNTTIGKDMIFYVLYLLALLLPQYFKGGYFQDIYIPLVFVMSIMMIYHIKNEYSGTRYSLVQSRGEIFLLILTILYGLSFFYGINKRGSIIEFTKYIGFLSIFLISRDLHKNKKKRSITIDIIILSGIFLSIIGIGTITGTWEYSGSYSGSRLSSTFQYPNTLAAYAAFMYFLTMGQALVEEKSWKIGIYGGALAIFFSTLIFTYSRGMWLIFPVVLLIYFILLSTRKKVQLFFYTLGNLLISLPLSFLFLRIVDGEATNLWTIYIIGILLSGTILFILGKSNRLLEKVSGKMVGVIIISLAIIAGIVLMIFVNTTEPISYENFTDEDSLNRLTRTVGNIYPNTEYKINIIGEATNNREDGYAGRILVYSTNEKNKHTHIKTFDIAESGEFNEAIDITTLEDTNSLLIYFENRLKDTSITFNEASIEDLESGDKDKIPLEYKYIPENIVRRVFSISGSDSSFIGRVVFSKDALKLAGKNPIFGSGGSGWETAYRSVQSYPYWSKQVHNHFIQVLVEVGALGLLLFLGLLINLGYKYILFKKSDREENHKTMVDTLMIACFSILAHAFIDFDFALIGYFVIFWLLLGMISSMVNEDKKEINIFSLKLDKKFLKKLNVVITLLLVMSILLSSTIYAGIYYNEKAFEAQNKGNIDDMEKYMEKASAFDPYNKDYRESLVEIYLLQYQNKEDTSYGNLAKEQVDKSLEMAKEDPLVHIKAAESYFKFGLIDEGLALLNRAMELQPLVTQTYLQNTNSYIAMFNYYLNQNELDKAQEKAKEGYEKVYTSLLAANEKTIRPMSKNNELFWELNELKYYGENMEEFLSYYERVWRLKYFYDFDLDVDKDGKLELVNIWNSKGGALDYEIKEEGVTLKNTGLEYGVFDSINFNLEPNKAYTVSFDARGDMDKEKATFYILDTKAEEQIQTDSIKLDLKEDYQTYEYEFTTDEDVGEDSSRFRFVIGGENEGYIDLKEIKIFEKLN